MEDGQLVLVRLLSKILLAKHNALQMISVKAIENVLQIFVMENMVVLKIKRNALSH